MKKFLIFLACGMQFSCTSALDLPTFYRAPFFQGRPERDLADFTTYLDIRYAEGDAHKGFNAHNDEKSLLSIYGNVDVNNLGFNIQGLSPTFKPVTYQYLRKDGGIVPGYDFTGENGTLRLKGKFKIKELDLSVQQNLLKGFFAQAYLPIRKLRVNEVQAINLTDPTNVNAPAFQSFLDNNFDTVLAENGYDPLLTPFSKTGASDLALYAGWQGYSSNDFGIIKGAGGNMRLGVILPIAAHLKYKKIPELPLGYNGCVSLSARAQAEVDVFNWFSVGGNAGVDIFFPKTLFMRLPTDFNQRGLIILQQARAKITPGEIWDLGGYLTLYAWEKSISLLFGYSFTMKEVSHLHVKDANYLKTFLEVQKADPAVVEKNSQDQIANSAVLWRKWQYHTLHFLLSYDAHRLISKNFGPRFEIFYNYPVTGKLSYKTPTVGGTAGVSVAWDF